MRMRLCDSQYYSSSPPPTMTVRPKVMARRLKLAEKLAKNNGGKLPNPWKMIQQGQSGLYRYIHRHPKAFEHFEVEDAVEPEPTKRNGEGSFNIAIREEHLKKARQLASKNNGVLQDSAWLIRHGHTRLASYAKTYPYVFVRLHGKQKNGLTHKKRRRKDV